MEPLWSPHDEMGGRDLASRPALVIGALSELRATELLLERGHRVAKPITDDFGIDLIVDYHLAPITVQVKCTRANVQFSQRPGIRTHAPVWRFRGLERVVADVIMFHVRPIDGWWIAPAAAVPPNRNINIMESRLRAPRRGAAYNMDPWRERWDLFTSSHRDRGAVLEFAPPIGEE